MNSKNIFYSLSDKDLNINIEDIENINEEEIFINVSEPTITEIANHIRVTNSSNFNIKFIITYTMKKEEFSLDSSEFLPSYARQVSFPKNATSIHLNIYALEFSKEDYIIYTSNLKVTRNYEFTVTGTINSSIITEN